MTSTSSTSRSWASVVTPSATTSSAATSSAATSSAATSSPLTSVRPTKVSSASPNAEAAKPRVRDTYTFCPVFWHQLSCHDPGHDLCHKVKGKATTPWGTFDDPAEDTLSFQISGRTYTHPREGLDVATLAYNAMADAVLEADRKEAQWADELFRSVTRTPVSTSSIPPPLRERPKIRLEWNHFMGFFIHDEQYHKPHGKLLTLSHLHVLPKASVTKLSPIWCPPGRESAQESSATK